MNFWTQEQAVKMCVRIEQLAPLYGCHVALTGGTLYKGGFRKDCDILFYRIREEKEIAVEALFVSLEKIGLVKTSGEGWLCKATYEGRSVDCFFPESAGNGYVKREAV